jgi:hypothetical protein
MTSITKGELMQNRFYTTIDVRLGSIRFGAFHLEVDKAISRGLEEIESKVGKPVRLVNTAMVCVSENYLLVTVIAEP